ncbi:MAG: hypothetical protein VCB79_13520, partial [Dehalococcoidia bacterium]
MTYDLVIVDCDGVLVDTERISSEKEFRSPPVLGNLESPSSKLASFGRSLVRTNFVPPVSTPPDEG